MRATSCGIAQGSSRGSPREPQDSVVRPSLWEVGYDPVLRANLPSGVDVVYYDDDTLVLVSGATIQKASKGQF